MFYMINFMNGNIYIYSEPDPVGRLAHQFNGWASGLTFARRYNLNYIYYPFQGTVASWNDFLGFGNNELDFKTFKMMTDYVLIELRSPTFLKLFDIIKNFAISSTLGIPIVIAIRIGAQWDQDYDLIRNELQLKYLKKTNNLKDLFVSNNTKVAVHIRRGDTVEITNIDDMHFCKPIQYYDNILNDIIKCDFLGNLEIIIFSDGSDSELYELAQKYSATLYNKNEHFSFLSMSRSDILITGKSGFSQLAAYLGNPIVINDPDYKSFVTTRYITPINSNINISILEDLWKTHH